VQPLVRRHRRIGSSHSLAELAACIEKLDAREACQTTSNEYLHYMDGSLTEDLIDVFSQHADLIGGCG
jgi:hypothetical protein